mmetsp:Transcript_34496/g.106637  ORF Transcript_34496/g.106637 Transcript_34496/m.106637 type:complete len:223 (-) Transcript_34496:111-779(-)
MCATRSADGPTRNAVLRFSSTTRASNSPQTNSTAMATVARASLASSRTSPGAVGFARAAAAAAASPSTSSASIASRAASSERPSRRIIASCRAANSMAGSSPGAASGTAGVWAARSRYRAAKSSVGRTISSSGLFNNGTDGGGFRRSASKTASGRWTPCFTRSRSRCRMFGVRRIVRGLRSRRLRVNLRPSRGAHAVSCARALARRSAQGSLVAQAAWCCEA